MVESANKRGVVVNRKAGEDFTVNGVLIRVRSVDRGKVEVVCIGGKDDKIDFAKSTPTGRTNPKSTSIVFKTSRSNQKIG
jgi:hypothetical protein